MKNPFEKKLSGTKYPMTLEFLAKTSNVTKSMLKSYLWLELISKDWFIGKFYAVGKVDENEIKNNNIDALSYETDLRKQKLTKLIDKTLKDRKYITTENRSEYFWKGKKVSIFDDEDEKGNYKEVIYDRLIETEITETKYLTGKWKEYKKKKEKSSLKNKGGI